MKVNYKIVLYTSDKKKDGTSPIALRITYKGNRKYYWLNLTCTPDKWNKTDGRFNRNKEGNRKLEKVEIKAENVINKIQDEHKGFSFARFNELFSTSSKPVYLFPFWQQRIKELNEDGKIGNATVYKDAFSALSRFSKDMLFIDIDYNFLEKYKRHLLSTTSINTTSIYLRTFRAIYNLAIKKGLVSKDFYPFSEVKIQSEETIKRSLKKEHIELIYKFDLKEGTRLWHSRNMFIIGYLCQGINFKDLCMLKWDENIVADRLIYRRGKTGKLFSIKIQGALEELLNKYKGGEYIFNILEDGLTPKTIKHRVNGRAKLLNKDLKNICRWLEIPNSKNITYYWGRHTYATVLKRSGVETAKISEALGHASEKVTQIYLDSFENEVIDKLNSNLL